jgi:3-oxoacyl-[acyl-carrier protein] reductase
MVARDKDALTDAAAPSAAGGATVYPLVSDLESPGAIDVIVAAARDLGGADILVNNAAIQGPIGPVWETDIADFERTLRLDFVLPVALARALLPDMIARGAGWIVNISGGGATRPRPLFAPYGAAKTALVRFAETLAAETAEYGVRVNSIAPGPFASAMTQTILAVGESAGASEKANAQRLLAEGDDSAAHKAAKLVAYLVSGPGRDVTGKLISAVWDPWSELHLHWDKLRASDVYTLRRIVPDDRP